MFLIYNISVTGEGYIRVLSSFSSSFIEVSPSAVTVISLYTLEPSIALARTVIEPFLSPLAVSIPFWLTVAMSLPDTIVQLTALNVAFNG